MSGGGFGPPPTYVDQNTPSQERETTLESGALDSSITLTIKIYEKEVTHTSCPGVVIANERKDTMDELIKCVVRLIK